MLLCFQNHIVDFLSLGITLLVEISFSMNREFFYNTECLCMKWVCYIIITLLFNFHVESL